MVGVSCHRPGRRFTRVILSQRLSGPTVPNSSFPLSSPTTTRGAVYDRIVPHVPTNRYATRPAFAYRLSSVTSAKLLTGRIMPCRTITSVNLYVDNPSLILEYLVRRAPEVIGRSCLIELCIVRRGLGPTPHPGPISVDSCGYQTHVSAPRSEVRESCRWSRLTA